MTAEVVASGKVTLPFFKYLNLYGLVNQSKKSNRETWDMRKLALSIRGTNKGDILRRMKYIRLLKSELEYQLKIFISIVNKMLVFGIRPQLV